VTFTNAGWVTDSVYPQVGLDKLLAYTAITNSTYVTTQTVWYWVKCALGTGIPIATNGVAVPGGIGH
jgi:hypothetical protein